MTEKFEEGGCLNSRTSLETSILEMASFRPESHVAQQSRRDKLRVQNPSGHHFQELPSHILHLPRDHSLPNHDFYQVPSVRNCNLLYDPATMLSPDMLGFSSNTHLFLGHKDVATQPESLDDASFPPSTVLPASSGFNHSSKSSDAQNPNCWSMNYVSNSGSVVCNQSPSFVGPFSCSNLKQKSVTASPTYVKTGYSGYQDVQSSLNNQPSEVSSQEAQKQYGEVSFNYPSFYPSGLSEVVSTSHTMGSQGFEMLPLGYNHGREAGHGSWVDGGSELLLLPSYVGQAAPPRVANGGPWLNRPVGSCLQWNSEEGCVANKGEGNFGSIGSDSRSQVLSLSLSSHLPSKLNVNPSNERFQTEVLPPSTTDVGHLISPHQEALVSGNSKCIGNLIQNMATSSVDARRTAGPLGPFTGYATILKSSKFLRPARQLLDDFCCISRAKLANSRCQISEVGGRDQTSISGYTLTGENEVGGRSGNSGGSTPSLYSSTETCGEGGGGSGVCQVYQPEFQRKKAKLLYMQGEVCRRYKQYHQQMQMVMSSFETVAGLSAATPYSSLALKSISKHFRCLKNAISEQIRHISNALGEELMSVGASNCDSTMPKLKLIEQCFQKQKTGDKAGFVEHPQPVWRPQRGLPERAVAVLRAWLFEHFLHPYPTDTDKHMLAAQTGLSRNQVSNWFINARVRVWKPMVEEIHMLETMGSPEMDRSTMKTNRNPSSNKEAPTNSQSNKLMIDAFPDEQSNCSAVGSDRNTGDDCSLQKRSKVEVCQIPVSVGAGLMGFLPTHGGLEFVGAGAVSLTLGLRHSAESAQQQQQQQQLRSHFGGNMVHDFVG